MNLCVAVIAQYLIIAIGLISITAIILSERTVRNDMIRLAVLSFAIAFLVAFVAGACYYSDRPFVIENTTPLVPHQPDNGFPSHHTLAGVVAAAVIFIYRRRLGVLLLVLGLLVGAARIMAGLHYPLDIASSIVIAIVAVFCAWLVLKKVGGRF